jgi:hypothetical protein
MKAPTSQSRAEQIMMSFWSNLQHMVQLACRQQIAHHMAQSWQEGHNVILRSHQTQPKNDTPLLLPHVHAYLASTTVSVPATPWPGLLHNVLAAGQRRSTPCLIRNLGQTAHRIPIRLHWADR